MPLWSYTKKPTVINLSHYPPGAYVAETPAGWAIIHAHGDQVELLVPMSNLSGGHDDAVNNFEDENGDNFILEDNTDGSHYFMLE
jgi:hypothetical protein